MTKSVSELMLLPVNVLLGGKDRRANIPYGPEESMTYDEYPSMSVDTPLVVFWYGGGWKKGRKEMYRFVGHALQQMGAHVFVVDYPKYPARVYPGFLDDAVVAVSHIKSRYPGRRVILMGHSSGGHTALLLGVRSLVKVDAVVAIAAPSTIDEQYWRPVFGQAIKEGLTDPRNYADTAPSDVATLLFHGSRDAIVGVQDSITLHDRLRRAGKDSRLVVLKGLDHMLVVPLLILGLLPAAHKRLKQFVLG